jgi:hypothetical protein
MRAAYGTGTKRITSSSCRASWRRRRIEELKKAQELKHTLRPLGPTLGM